MNPIFEVTAQYSNTVLLAILPHLSDFAGRLELPIPKPISPAHVRRFNCVPSPDTIGHFGGLVVLTNGFEFWFDHGIVDGFASPWSYKRLQDPALIPKFFGKPVIDRQQALALARTNLRKLGYGLRQLYADIEPQTTEDPKTIGTNIVPYYRFEWEHPLAQIFAVEIEINAAYKTIESLRLWNDSLWREPPKVSVTPRPIKAREPPLDAGQSNAFVNALLAQVSSLANKLELFSYSNALKTGQVERLAVLTSLNGEMGLKLTNGYWFLFNAGELTGFCAPNSLYKRWYGERFRPVAEYVGRWSLSETQAVTLARKTIEKAGYEIQHFEAEQRPEVHKPKQIGPYVIPRYLVRWTIWHPQLASTVLADASIEVDADTGTVKYLSVFDGQKGPPKYE